MPASCLLQQQRWDGIDLKCWRYTRTQDSGSGLFLPFIFCNNATGMSTTQCLLPPLLLLIFALLFRLGRKAKEYFSTSLKIFLVELGLPKRFTEWYHGFYWRLVVASTHHPGIMKDYKEERCEFFTRRGLCMDLPP